MSVNYQNYLKVCHDAATDESVFKTFKSNPSYNVVLEHVSLLQGRGYLLEISKELPRLLSHVKKFATNDHIGSPRTYHMKEIGIDMSPTTLRYIKVLADLINIFGVIDNMRVVEIGVGYGGQCKIISDITELTSYTLVDLPEVLSLATKYLGVFGVKNVIAKNPEDDMDDEYDLCISNYAFTEIDRHYQDIYAEKIIKHSTQGYITCNFFGQRGGDGAMSKDEIYALRPNGKFIPEKPLTAPNNIIYTWKL